MFLCSGIVGHRHSVIEDIVGVDTVDGVGGSKQPTFSLQCHLVSFDVSDSLVLLVWRDDG